MKKQPHPMYTKGTTTAEGFVPYLDYNGIKLCVKLDIPRVSRSAFMREFFPPLRRDGKLVYALPGGGELVVGDD